MEHQLVFYADFNKVQCYNLKTCCTLLSIKLVKFLDLVVKGIGYHHAGMDVQDRKLIEETFAKGELPVLGEILCLVFVFVLL
jgi:superfamily II helicase